MGVTALGDTLKQSIDNAYAGVANIHFSATLPNFLILESIETWGGFHSKLLKKPIRWEEGYVIPPSEPGLGIELDENALEKQLGHDWRNPESYDKEDGSVVDW